MITKDTTLAHVAALVSTALENAGIDAVLGGGGAVSLHSDARYMSKDLDFITVERNQRIAPVLAKLGFHLKGKYFVHHATDLFVEFPPGPISFGDTYVDPRETAILETEFGRVRIITPTQSVMDRLASWLHFNDPEAWKQGQLVCEAQEIDWQALTRWANKEGIDSATMHAFRSGRRARRR